MVSIITANQFRQWLDAFTLNKAGGALPEFLDPGLLPFSFEYGGRSSDELLPTWARTKSVIDAPQGEWHTIIWDGPAGLRVEWKVLVYKDYTAAEMRLVFEHRGSTSAEVLCNVRPLRHRVTGVPFEVIYATGGLGNWQQEPGEIVPANLKPMVRRLSAVNDRLEISARGGWSSNRHLPFWLVLGPHGQGLYYSLGWTGQWKARFEVDSSGMLGIAAGMEHMNLRLKPGERISQPSVLLGYFTGGRWAGHNALRRILYEQYAALLNGRKPLPPVSWNHWFTFGNSINEQNALELVKSAAPLGIEYFCIDAGWYNVDFWQSGDWRPNPKKFPRGMEPVAEAIRRNGMVMGLWFDPERVTSAAYDAFEHKEWLIPASKKPANEGGPVNVWLLDLRRPEVRQWMVNLIGDYVRTLNLEWIRYDMNYSPLEMWLNVHENEPDRLGMMEILYVEGLYEVLDRLLKNHPNLVIEWCAGGGRRIDMETIRRSHTFWKSDITGDGDVTRSHLTGGNLFLPGNYLNSNLIRQEGTYDYYCQFGGPLGFGHDFRPDSPQKVAEAVQMIQRFKKLRHFLVEDYYPLFGDYPADQTGWDGWQFHDPKKNEGFFLIFRPPVSPYTEAIIKLHGLDVSGQYTLSPAGPADIPKLITGQSLIDGMAVRIQTPRQALLVDYQPVD